MCSDERVAIDVYGLELGAFDSSDNCVAIGVAKGAMILNSNITD